MENGILIPSQLVAGDSWKWTVNLPDFSFAGGDRLKAFFRGRKNLDLIATEDPDTGAFLMEATQAQTKDLDWGTILVQMVVVNGDTRTEVGRVSVEILRNFESIGEGEDARSWTKRTLDAVSAVLEGRAGRAEREYTVGTGAGMRQLALMNPKELYDFKKQLEADYALEVARTSPAGKSNQILARFIGE